VNGRSVRIFISFDASLLFISSMICFPPETVLLVFEESFSSRFIAYGIDDPSLRGTLSLTIGLLVRCMHRDKAQDSQLVKFDDNLGCAFM